MFNQLRRKVFAYHVNQFNKRVERTKKYVDYAHAKSVLVLYESEPSENRNFISEVIRTLTSDGKRVSVYGFVPKKMAISSSMNNFNMLDIKSLDFFYQPKSSLLQLLEEDQFDLVIDLTVHFCQPLQYLLLHANAPCKVGGSVGEFGLIDFAVKMPEPEVIAEDDKPDISVQLLYEKEKELWREILYYLKSIGAAN